MSVSRSGLHRASRASLLLFLALGASYGFAQSRTLDQIMLSRFETPAACAPQFPNEMSVEWTGFFTTWPSFGDRNRLLVPYNGYIAFRFNASYLTTEFGVLNTAKFPNDGDGMGTMSISTTPGCFDPAYLDDYCLAPIARYPGVSWSNFPALYSCVLVPGREYFLNITYGGAYQPSAPYCPGGACSTDLVPYGQH